MSMMNAHCAKPVIMIANLCFSWEESLPENTQKKKNSSTYKNMNKLIFTVKLTLMKENNE